MSINKRLDMKKLADNPITRLASCLVLDTSHSMRGKPIKQLIKGIELYKKALVDDSTTRDKVEVAIITFGNSGFGPKNPNVPHKGVKLINDFTDAESLEIPQLVADGYTPMGEAVELALEILEERKEMYGKTSGSYEQPWMIIMTDGNPYDYKSKMEKDGKYDYESVKKIASKTTDLVKKEKTCCSPCGYK